ncbi:phosphoenolpyruvate carboxylase, partial [Priestia megaterium]|nr:phosphoenolpyruvate carboxylase [Priestia megaterium]
MTTHDQQITPADAAIVSSGTGTKGPEERDLPASLKEEMDLCLQILREVLGEFDERLLETFDEVRGYALNASAERFAGILTDTNPNQDDLQNVVGTVDKMNIHDAQLLARAFATYFHLANLCEENYR